MAFKQSATNDAFDKQMIKNLASASMNTQRDSILFNDHCLINSCLLNIAMFILPKDSFERTSVGLLKSYRPFRTVDSDEDNVLFVSWKRSGRSTHHKRIRKYPDAMVTLCSCHEAHVVEQLWNIENYKYNYNATVLCHRIVPFETVNQKSPEGYFLQLLTLGDAQKVTPPNNPKGRVADSVYRKLGNRRLSRYRYTDTEPIPSF